MSDPAFTTRDQAEAPPARLLRVLCRAYYEADRSPGSSRPPFDETCAQWQDAMHKAMTAAIRAGEADGWRIER